MFLKMPGILLFFCPEPWWRLLVEFRRLGSQAALWCRPWFGNWRLIWGPEWAKQNSALVYDLTKKKLDY